MKFTKEEISLCKQIREKDLLLKPVKEGDWVRNEYGKPSTDLVTSEYIRDVLRFTDIKHWFPLWTISDCVDFLREKGCKNYLYLLHYESPLETCLKAVLAVLEKKS